MAWAELEEPKGNAPVSAAGPVSDGSNDAVGTLRRDAAVNCCVPVRSGHDVLVHKGDPLGLGESHAAISGSTGEETFFRVEYRDPAMVLESSGGIVLAAVTDYDTALFA
jgi:hypothetical protein